MSGIEIVFKSFRDLTRFLSLDGVSLSGHFFSCIDHSVYYHSKATQLKNTISYIELLELSKKPYVIERLNLQAYQCGSIPKQIESYQDFLSSQCRMIILAYDGVYLEVYAKENQWLDQLLHNAASIELEHLSIKTPNTDIRKGMYV